MDYKSQMKKIKYDTVKFNFQKRLENLFNINDLSTINDNVAIFKRENDQKTSYHKLYYNFYSSLQLQK